MREGFGSKLIDLIVPAEDFIPKSATTVPPSGEFAVNFNLCKCTHLYHDGHDIITIRNYFSVLEVTTTRW